MKNLNNLKTVNSVTLLGKIARVPEQKNITSGRKLSVFSLQTQNDDKYSSLEFHNIVAWDEISESVNTCNLSDIVYIEGSIKTRNFINKHNVKIYKTEIIAHKIILLSSEENNSITQEEEKTFFSASKKDFYS